MAEQIVEVDGVKHIFKTELENMKSWEEWIKDTKTAEEFHGWVKNKGSTTDEFVSWYNEWLVDQKITHTIIDADGKEQTNSHTEL